MIINNQKKSAIYSLNKYNSKNVNIKSTSMKDKDNKDLKVAKELLYKDKEYKASTIKNKYK